MLGKIAMNPLVIRALIVLAGAAAAFGAGWSVNGWRLGEQIAQMERDQVTAVAAQNEVARLKERSMMQQVEKARNAATKRETTLRRDAAAARTAADSLRGDLADLRRQLPSLTADAVRRYADTASVVLGECTDKYQELAEQADRLDSDRQTLEQAWPK